MAATRSDSDKISEHDSEACSLCRVGRVANSGFETGDLLGSAAGESDTHVRPHFRDVFDVAVRDDLARGLVSRSHRHHRHRDAGMKGNERVPGLVHRRPQLAVCAPRLALQRTADEAIEQRVAEVGLPQHWLLSELERPLDGQPPSFSDRFLDFGCRPVGREEVREALVVERSRRCSPLDVVAEQERLALEADGGPRRPTRTSIA